MSNSLSVPARPDEAESDGDGDDGMSIKPVKKYGTFEGVFVPTVLTILGVIMYLREGFVVGETYDVIEQRITVTPAQAEMVARLAKAYGPVPKAQCSLSINRILSQVPGFQTMKPTYYPVATSDRFATLPGVTRRVITDDDADKNHNVLIEAVRR